MNTDAADAATCVMRAWMAADLGPRLQAAVAAGRGVRQERSRISLPGSWEPRVRPPTRRSATVCDRRARDLTSASSASICGARSRLIQQIQSASDDPNRLPLAVFAVRL